MTAYYLDTSALVKRYALEQGTSYIRNLTDPAQGHDLYTVRITGPEMIAAFYRKVREKLISPTLATRLSSNFRTDWQRRYIIVEVSATVADQAMSLAEKRSLRGYDAVHLAAALELHHQRLQVGLPALTFVSADNHQLSIATAEGLQIENPTLYP